MSCSKAARTRVEVSVKQPKVTQDEVAGAAEEVVAVIEAEAVVATVEETVLDVVV